MSAEKSNNLVVDLKQITDNEFIIAVIFQNKIIANLYIRGNRQYANEMLEVARRRILLNIVGERSADLSGRVAFELSKLEQGLKK
jgi:hypothetical protein